MLLQGSHIAEQKILLVKTYRVNLREFADCSKHGHLARVARLKY